VFVQPFPPSGVRYQLPKNQIDFHPTWAPSGDELFYVPVTFNLVAVPVTTRPTLTFGSSTALGAGVIANRVSNVPRDYDVLPDGRFVGLIVPSEQTPTGAVATSMEVVINWFDELKQRIAPGTN
jgi:hypothetical protein